MKRTKENFAKYLVEHGMRRTPERFAILECVMGMPGLFSCSDVRAALKEGGTNVMAPTIYTTLRLMIEAGLVRSYLSGARNMRFEVVSRREPNTIHTVCRCCGKIRIIKSRESHLRPDDFDLSTFRAEYLEVSIYGLCKSCQRKISSRKKSHQHNSRIHHENFK